jgi:hypothetical protein
MTSEKSWEELTSKLLAISEGTPAYSKQNTYGKANPFIA